MSPSSPRAECAASLGELVRLASHTWGFDRRLALFGVLTFGLALADCAARAGQHR
jgi:hypothetical protein